jgi:hypothetical protein
MYISVIQKVIIFRMEVSECQPFNGMLFVCYKAIMEIRINGRKFLFLNRRM